MRHSPAAALSMLLLTTACTKTAPPAPTLSGTYTGTFQRQDAAGTGPVAPVSLTFSGGTWTGTSQQPKYPGLCNGTYRLTGSNEITFENACAWTADFDWTLILSKAYTLAMKDDEVKLSRKTGASQDVYKLKTQ